MPNWRRSQRRPTTTSVGGAEFVGELWDAIQLVREFPYAGTPVGNGVRRVVLQRYRYNLLYVPETEAIFVVAVAHQRLRPEYWRYRLDS
jgi:toxin ParE1/3/4